MISDQAAMRSSELTEASRRHVSLITGVVWRHTAAAAAAAVDTALSDACVYTSSGGTKRLNCKCKFVSKFSKTITSSARLRWNWNLSDCGWELHYRLLRDTQSTAVWRIIQGLRRSRFLKNLGF